jgi:hypothetical protein
MSKSKSKPKNQVLDSTTGEVVAEMDRQPLVANGLRYIGKGAHLGVPRRDLTPEEVGRFGFAWLLSLHCPNTGRAMYAELTEENDAEPEAENEEMEDVNHG